MTEIEELKRVISLKKSGIPLIKNEIKDCQIRLALLLLRDEYEQQGANNYIVSRKLDCVNYILEK